MSSQVKSEERVINHGEVFTAEREVNAMLDLVKQETERIDSRFLEPACGDGNFLAAVLERKMTAAKVFLRKSKLEYERKMVLAIASLYGVDILKDNVEACRSRLFKLWDEAYTQEMGDTADENCRLSVRFILQCNILHGNTLSMKQVDERGADTEMPIIFSEWSIIRGSLMQRKENRLDTLLEERQGIVRKPLAEDLFSVGIELKQETFHYKKIHHHD